MELNYHKRSFQIIDDEPHFSAKNIQKIEEFENHHRIKLPLSLKEWYSIENHHTILQNLIDRTLNHTVILFENCHNFGSLVKTGQRSDNLLYVLEENQ
ncbi:MAG: hypothetical protein IAF02_29070, partial [Anaerolineae bacterium]|nr:hypothetical protein [Anaerolineae bacterium]